MDALHACAPLTGAKSSTAQRARWVARAGFVAGAYVAAAKLGLELRVAHGVITPVWPPAGIALAALVIGGPSLWPAVAVGAFAANVTSDASVAVSAFIAVGNTLEALVGAALLRRARFRISLDRARDVLALIFLAAGASTAVSATNGVTTLAIAGASSASDYDSAWLLWWLGDAMGDLLVAPLLFVWAVPALRALAARRRDEAAALLALLAGASALVFLGGMWRYPYVLFPLLIWSTLRFRQLGAATAAFVAAAFAVAGVVGGDTPLAGHDPTGGVQILQALLALVAVSLLVLTATLSEREDAARAVEQANDRLAEAQEVAHLGSWEWEIAADRLLWSDELYRIFGLEPGSVELDYEGFLSRVHPSDRERVRNAVERALEQHEPYQITHRAVLPDGRERTLHGRGRVVCDSAGRAVRMVGTAQDVTDQYRVEQVRENILAAVSHELRTPLTSIIGFALTLRDREHDLSPATRRQAIRHLAEQSLRLERLLADLLDIDRLRHGRIELAVERVDVRELVARVAAPHQSDGYLLQVSDVPVPAEVDPAKVERIVENLLLNALKHTPPGTRITLAVERDENDVLVCVEDRGPGVPDAYKSSIFELFARGADGATRSAGAGVGLALVAQFAALHGGSAWVEDNAHGGASFKVRLRTGRQRSPATG